MRLYALAIAALRTNEIGVQSAVGVWPDEVDATAASLEAARDLFPASDGWHDHYVTATEITQHFPLDPWRLVWSLEDGQAHRPEGPADQCEGAAPRDR